MIRKSISDLQHEKLEVQLKKYTLNFKHMWGNSSTYFRGGGGIIPREGMIFKENINL